MESAAVDVDWCAVLGDLVWETEGGCAVNMHLKTEISFIVTLSGSVANI